MKTVQTLYNLLGISSKIRDTPTRFFYLKEVWGLEQNDIAAIEGVSQSQVSKLILQAKKKNPIPPYLEFTSDELKYIQFLPREIISDSQVVAFVNNILEYTVEHSFFQFYGQSDSIRIAALASMGIQNKRLQQLFNKAQSSVSMSIQRNAQRAANLERPSRYEESFEYPVKQSRKVVPKKPKFLLAGGQE